jgi:hypothetical protein
MSSRESRGSASSLLTIMAQGGFKAKKGGAHGYGGKQGKATKMNRRLGKTKKGGLVKAERKKFTSHHHQQVHQFKKKRSAIVRTSVEQEMAAQAMRANIPVRLVDAGDNDVKPILAKRPSKKNPYAKRPARPAKAMNPLDPKAMKQAAKEWAADHAGYDSD